MLGSSTSTVTLVIVTHNRAQYLRRTLDAVMSQTVISTNVLKIVVVDNASRDETPQVLEDFSHQTEKLQIVRSEINLGGSGGFALGIKTAVQTGAKWIGVCDDDVVLAPNAVENILRYSKDQCILGCLRLNEEGRVVERASRSYDLSNPFLINPRRKALCENFTFPEELQPTELVAFCSFEGMFFPSNLIDEIGLPTQEYFIFGDDCDFCFRARNVGWKTYIVRDARLARLISYDRKALFLSWKSYYVMRNFFVLHFLYGENILVRLKPFVLLPFLVIHTYFTGGKVNVFSSLYQAIKLAHKLKSRKEKKEFQNVPHS